MTGESRLDTLIQAGIFKTRDEAIVQVALQILAKLVAKRVHPQTIIAGGFEAFAASVIANSPDEGYTPAELRRMWGFIQYSAENPRTVQVLANMHISAN